jgi:hypothetical protein
LEIPGVLCHVPRKTVGASRASPRNKPCGLLLTRLYGQGFSSPLELTFFHHVVQILDKELQDLMFVLLAFSLVLVPSFHYMRPFFLFEMEIFFLSHCKICNLTFWVIQGLTTKSLPWVSEETLYSNLRTMLKIWYSWRWSKCIFPLWDGH